MSNEEKVVEENQEKPERVHAKRIEEAWTQFSKAVLPPDAPPAQMKWMRRAFFAGAQGLTDELMEAVSGDSAENFMNDVMDELLEFAKSVLAGIE